MSAVQHSGSNSLRSRQIAAIRQFVNLNEVPKTAVTVEPVWKVLVYDRYGQDIISPLLTAKDLRDLGVTLFMLLDSEREALADVPAVYFVQPTDDNVRRICQDFTTGLYDSYYLNFITALPRPNLEDLAKSAVQCEVVNHVHKVFDQFLNFISLEEDMFTLRRHTNDNPLSYYRINRGATGQDEMNSIIDEIVEGLFAVCVTLGSVPIIRCPRNNAAEMVAEKLDQKIRDNMRDARNNLFTSDTRSGQLNFTRPVLVIVDRNMDMATPLHHTWTYQALVHDVLPLELNRVVIEETDLHKRGKRKEYDLNCSDKLWSAQKGSPFPAVAEAVQEELEEYRSKEDEVKRLKHAMGLDAESDEAITMISDTTARLTSTVSSLPELLEKKRLIDMHTNIATAVLEHIKSRKLDELFEAEEKLMGHSLPDTPLVNLLRTPEYGSKEDKLRILLIHYICNDVPESDIKTFTSVLEEAGCDLAPLKYIKRWKTFSKQSLSRDQYSGSGTKTVGMFAKLLSQSSQFVMEGVKNLVIRKHNLPLTRIVDAVMEMKSIPEVEDFRYFDPKLSKPPDSGFTVPRHKNPYQEAIVFVIGGGNYIEYQNLVDYRKVKSNMVPKKITYGTTELMNASQFLSQLSKLGMEV